MFIRRSRCSLIFSTYSRAPYRPIDANLQPNLRSRCPASHSLPQNLGGSKERSVFLNKRKICTLNVRAKNVQRSLDYLVCLTSQDVLFVQDLSLSYPLVRPPVPHRYRSPAVNDGRRLQHASIPLHPLSAELPVCDCRWPCGCPCSSVHRRQSTQPPLLEPTRGVSGPHQHTRSENMYHSGGFLWLSKLKT